MLRSEKVILHKVSSVKIVQGDTPTGIKGDHSTHLLTWIQNYNVKYFVIFGFGLVWC